MKRRKTKKVKMVRVLGETVRRGSKRHGILLSERRHFLERQRDPNSYYYGVPISELLKSNRRRGLRRNSTPTERLRERLKRPRPGYEYNVQGYYSGQWEDVDAHDNRYDAIQSRKNYDENERQYPHRVIVRRIKANRRRGLRRNPSESPSDYYYKLLRARVPMDSHESDLYVKDTPTARAILADWPFGRLGRFKNNINGEIYIDIPFAYAPYWEKKVRR